MQKYVFPFQEYVLQLLFAFSKVTFSPSYINLLQAIDSVEVVLLVLCSLMAYVFMLYKN